MALMALRLRKKKMDARILVLAGILASLRNHQVSAQTPERRYACWGSFGPPVVSAQCPRNTVIQIIRAGLKVQNHVGLCAYNDNDCGCEYGQKGCQMQDVRQLCMGRPACRLDVTQQYINTPTCRGFSDYMYIEFNCVPVELNSVSDVCSNVRTQSESGFLKSPSNPSSSRATQQCDCSLSTEQDSSIQLTVVDFQTEDNSCDHNMLRVAYNGQSTSYCGQQAKEVDSKSNSLNVKYDTDGQGGESSFWLKYRAIPPNPVTLSCTQRIVEITTEAQTTTTERIVPTKPRKKKPKIYRPRKRKGRVQKQKKDNSAQEVFQTTATPAVTKPWWWRFTTNQNTTAFLRERDTTTFSSVEDKPLLSDPPRSRRYHSISTPRSRSSGSTSTSTTTENHYQHPILAHPKAIAGKSSSYFDPKHVPRANFDFTQANPTAFPLSPRGPENLWSHLPSSLLNKLQFPLPLIRALEKELVVAPDPNTEDQSFLRLLPALQPNEEITKYPKLQQEHVEKFPRRPRLRENRRKPAKAHKPMMNRKLKILNKLGIRSHNSSEKDLKLNSDKTFRSYGRTEQEWRVTKSPVRPNPGYFSEKTRFSNMKQALDQLGVALPEREKNHLKYFANRNKAHPYSNKERLDRGMKKIRKNRQFVVNKNNDRQRNKVKDAGEKTEGTKYKKKDTNEKPVHELHQINHGSITIIAAPHPEPSTTASTSTTTTTTETPKTTTTTKKPSTSAPTPRTTFKPEKKIDQIKINKDPHKYSGVPSKFQEKGKVRRPFIRRKLRKMQPKGGDFKVPTSKVAVQPVTWVEPMDFTPYKQDNGRMYTRDRTPIGQRRFPLRARQKYRYNRKQEPDTSQEDDGKKIFKRKRVRKVWPGRFESRRIVKPQPKMYVTPKHRKIGLELNKEDTIGMTEATHKGLNKSLIQTTTMPTKILTTEILSTITDSVHNDRFNVVEELVGKINTVSDFYKTLDEEDWTSWPAFEKVKNAPDLDGPISSISSVSDVGQNEKAIPNNPNPPEPYPEPEPQPRFRLQTTPPSTTTTNSAKPKYKIHPTRAAPTYASPTLDNSIPQMPQSTKMASASSRKIPADKVRRRTPGEPNNAKETPNQTEPLYGTQNNMVTIIAACVVGSILLLVILGIVIRFIMRRHNDREEGIHFATAKGVRRKLSETNFNGRKIPRPKRV